MWPYPVNTKASDTGNFKLNIFDRTTGLTLGFEGVPDPLFPKGSKESSLLSVVPNEAKGSPFPKGSSCNRLISWLVYEWIPEISFV